MGFLSCAGALDSDGQNGGFKLNALTLDLDAIQGLFVVFLLYSLVAECFFKASARGRCFFSLRVANRR